MLRRLVALLLAVGPLTVLLGTTPGHAAASWSWPLPGQPQVDRPFQPPASAWGAGHRGVDLRGELDEPVLAAGSGTVTYSGLLAGRGVVTVTHAGGLRTTYEPVDSSVVVGQHVDAGDVLGRLGTGHASCRPGVACLHWGLLRGRTYLDPLGLVVSGTLRLLPIGAKAPATDDHGKKRRSKEAKKASERSEGRLAKLRNGLRRAASKAGRVAKSGAKLVVRSAKAIGRGLKATGRVLRPLGRVALRVGSRAGPVLEELAPYALDAVPYVGLGALVVGGGVWYVRSR